MNETPNEAIRRIRKGRGLTMEQMAAECGISAPVISRLENGLRPNGDHAIALSRWSGEPIEVFYSQPPVRRAV